MSDLNRTEPVGADDDPVVAAYRRDLDLSLIRERLRMSVEERLTDLQRLQELAAELRRAGARVSEP